MDKKPYSPPTITEQGDAVKQTNGMGGNYWEIVAPRMSPITEKD